MRTLVLSALFIALAGPLPAQHDHGKAPPAGIGRVRFPTTCAPGAQPSLERGVALLHNFWYEEAAAAFREAGSRDSSCAMAWWGVGMTYVRPLWPPLPLDTLRVGAAAAARASAARTADARERGYVDALAAFYRDLGATAPATRLAAWKAGMEQLHAAHAGDREATMFYALSLIATAPRTDPTYAQYRQAGALLEPLFRDTPDHPGLAHYLIHATDAPGMAAAGLDAANRYAGIAPAVPHARHMPSHIYTLIGKWPESIESNRSSAEAGRTFEREQRLGGSWDQTLHALDYMVYAYLQQGRVADAAQVAAEAGVNTRVVPEGSLVGEYAVAAIPARLALEQSRWAEAAGLKLRTGPAPAQAVTWFARAVGAARSGDTALARVALAALEQSETASHSLGDPIWPTTVRAQKLAARAWNALALGDTAGALRLASEAADVEDGSVKHPVTPGAILPARELLGDLLLEVGRAGEARSAYEAALKLAPRRARSLAGAAAAAAKLGDERAAAAWRAELAAMRREGRP
jgi:tetratricopeptide (TPR) repeat protein